MAYVPTLKTKYKEEILPALMKEYGYKTVMQAPRLKKITLNQGLGKAAIADKKVIDKGKTGRVLNILPEQGKAIVEGVNIVSKSTKPNAKAPQGGIIKKEAPIHLSNLAVVDPKSGRDPKPTRVGFRKDENGKTVRYSKKTGEEIK